MSDLKHQNLVVVLNERLKYMDSKIEEIHPNVSVITLSKQSHNGANPVSSIAEVLSLI